MKPRLLRLWFSHRLDTQTCPLPHRYELLVRWRQGCFHYLGIQCKAVLLINGKRVTVASEGQWGIRSDHPLSIEHVQQMECQQMREILGQQGLGERAIEHAMKRIETCNQPETAEIGAHKI